MTQEREAFEAWIRTGEEFEMQWLNRRDFRDSERFGDYCENSIEWQWRAFKAGARASLAQPASAPVGWKLVPVEPTEAMFTAVSRHLDGGVYVGQFLSAYRSMLAAAPQAPQPAQAVPQLTGCNCRWDGETQVQWCELHLAHKEAIHDWAGRAKAAEAKLAAHQPEAQPHRGEFKALDPDIAKFISDNLWELAAPSAQAVPQQADTVTLVGVKADGTEHVLGTATMPPKMRAKELVREMFGSIDEETGDDGAMALWVCEQLIEWMQETSLVVTLTNQAEQGGTK